VPADLVNAVGDHIKSRGGDRALEALAGYSVNRTGPGVPSRPLQTLSVLDSLSETGGNKPNNRLCAPRKAPANHERSQENDGSVAQLPSRVTAELEGMSTIAPGPLEPEPTGSVPPAGEGRRYRQVFPLFRRTQCPRLLGKTGRMRRS
jgi:hypothetical protein